MLAIAEFQSDQIGESWRDAKRNMVLKKGLPPTAGPRFGYTYDRKTKTYEIDPISGPALRECYALYRDGYSTDALTMRLRNLGIVGLRGVQLSSTVLRRSMGSGFAAGLIRLDTPSAILTEEELEELGATPGEPLFLPGTWPKLIDEDLWLAYRERRRVQEQRPRRSRNPRRPLAGHLRCAGCNRRMLFRPDRGRWACSAQLAKSNPPCLVHVSIADSEVTEYVKEWLRELAHERGESFDALVAQQMRMQLAHGDRDSLTKQKTEAERQKANLVRAISVGALEPEDAADQMRVIKQEIQGLEGALANLRMEASAAQPPKDSFERLLASWDDAEASVLNNALAKLIDGVYVYPFRDSPRVIIRGVWEVDKVVPVADPVDLDFSEGRVCLGCKEWKPRGQFYVRTRGNQLMSRCKQCKAEAHAAWRQARTNSLT
jgi:site-specific DNA recombinase